MKTFTDTHGDTLRVYFDSGYIYLITEEGKKKTELEFDLLQATEVAGQIFSLTITNRGNHE